MKLIRSYGIRTLLYIRGIWLAFLIKQRASLSRADLSPFLWYFLTRILLLSLSNKKNPIHSLSMRGKVFLILHYGLLIGIIFVWALLIPRDYFDLWSIGLSIALLSSYLRDQSIRNMLKKYCKKQA